MTKKEWKLIVGLNFLTIFSTLSPFLPGPSFLSGLTNSIFNGAQMVGFLGIIFIPIGLIWMIITHSKKMLAILLWTIPTVAFICFIWGAQFAREYSRKIAMNNADTLINAIEYYKKNNNHYPENILELYPKYINHIPKPWVMGISDYYYQKSENSFVITFEQNVLFPFNFEVVMYDPTGKYERTYTTLSETNKHHWKYYIYD